MESFIIFLMLFSITIDPASHEYFTSQIDTTDGGTVLTGSLHRNDGIVIKLSANGSHEWTTFIPDAGEVSSLAEARNGYIVVGHHPFVSVNKHPRGFGWIGMLAKDGKIKWMHDFERGSYSEFHTVIATQDGNFLTVGLLATGETEDGWALKFSPQGVTIWYRAVDGDNTTDVFTDIKEMSFNEFMIFGTTDDRPMIVTASEKEDHIELVNLFLGY